MSSEGWRITTLDDKVIDAMGEQGLNCALCGDKFRKGEPLYWRVVPAEQGTAGSRWDMQRVHPQCAPFVD